jgi:hypothetical protein
MARRPRLEGTEAGLGRVRMSQPGAGRPPLFTQHGQGSHMAPAGTEAIYD